MPQAEAELVDRGKIHRFPRSVETGSSLQRSDQNKLNDKVLGMPATRRPARPEVTFRRGTMI
jgi:hypothetical protein